MSPTIPVKRRKLIDTSRRDSKFKRVFSPQNFELRNRYITLDPNKQYINLPKFDRGKRKISKMGGIQMMMFSGHRS